MAASCCLVTCTGLTSANVCSGPRQPFTISTNSSGQNGCHYGKSNSNSYDMSDHVRTSVAYTDIIASEAAAKAGLMWSIPYTSGFQFSGPRTRPRWPWCHPQCHCKNLRIAGETSLRVAAWPFSDNHLHRNCHQLTILPQTSSAPGPWLLAQRLRATEHTSWPNQLASNVR